MQSRNALLVAILVLGCNRSHFECEDPIVPDAGGAGMDMRGAGEVGKAYGSWVIDYGVYTDASYANGYKKGWRGFSLCQGDEGVVLSPWGTPTGDMAMAQTPVAFELRDQSDKGEYYEYKSAWQHTWSAAEVIGADLRMIMEYGHVLTPTGERTESMKVTFVSVTF